MGAGSTTSGSARRERTCPVRAGPARDLIPARRRPLFAPAGTAGTRARAPSTGDRFSDGIIPRFRYIGGRRQKPDSAMNVDRASRRSIMDEINNTLFSKKGFLYYLKSFKQYYTRPLHNKMHTAAPPQDLHQALKNKKTNYIS
jgi:hypothetical protein